MSNNDFEFSLDDILAEFKEVDSTPAVQPERTARPAQRPQPARAVEETDSFREPEVRRPAPRPATHRKPEPERAKERRSSAGSSESAKERMFEKFAAVKPSKPVRQKKTRKAEPAERRVRSANGKVAIISMAAFALLFVWGIFNVHPGASLPKPTPSPAVPTPVVTQAPVESTDTQTPPEGAGEGDVAEPVPTEPPKPHYSIPEGSVLAPKANPENFGSVAVANAAQLDDIIQQARDSGLLREDEKMVFDSSLAFNTGSYYQDIKYYLDDTMLAIAWKQIVDGNTVTCMEVKVADASQFRRKITGDTYGSPVDYLSNLNKSTNAVVSMNADFYQFRDYGVMVYDGVLYKCTDKRYLIHNGIDYKWYNCLDNCFITRDGDMIFTYFGEEFTWDSMQQFINDNNISFSLSFGPILVDNYEVQTHYADWYPVGEVDQGYSRAGFGQVDERHYLYMSLNHSDEKSARWTMLEFGQFFQSRGVEKAYAFDGGQTSEIIFNGEIYNHIDKSSERWVSDMVYFGTALPEEVWNNG